MRPIVPLTLPVAAGAVGVVGSLAVTGSLTVAVAVIVVTVLVVVLVVRVKRSRDADEGLPGVGGAVLLPISRPSSASGLTQLAAAIASADRGRVLPLHVLPPDPDQPAWAAAQELLRATEDECREMGCEAAPILRVGSSTAEGVLHAAVERNATLVVVGWPSEGRRERELGRPVDRIVEDVPAPVVLARLDGYDWARVVLVPPQRQPDGGELASLRLAREVASRVAHAHGVDLELDTQPHDGHAQEVLAGVPVAVVPVHDGGEIGDTTVLTVVPVAPELPELDRTLRRVSTSGDVLLVLSHGPAAEDRRPLLPAAEDLYEQGHDPSPGPQDH